MRFIEGREGLLSALEVQAPARRDVLEDIYGALHAERIQIVSAISERWDGAFRHRLQLVELDGAPIPDWRRLAIQTTVLAHLDGSMTAARPAFAVATT